MRTVWDMRSLALVLLLAGTAFAQDDGPERAGWKVIWSPEGYFAYPAEPEEPGEAGSVQSEPAPPAAPAPAPSPAAAALPVPLPAPSAAVECSELRDRFAQRAYELRGVMLDEETAGWVRRNHIYPGSQGPVLQNPWITYAAMGYASADWLAFNALSWDTQLRSLAEDLARCEAP